jgi:hypothetical protein
MDEPISPDAFRDSIAETAERLGDKLKSAVATESMSAMKEQAKEKLKMGTADKVWIAVIGGGGLFLRDRHQRKKIKGLMKISTALYLENEFLHAFITGLMDPSADKAEILKGLTAKLQKLKTIRAA